MPIVPKKNLDTKSEANPGEATDEGWNAQRQCHRYLKKGLTPKAIAFQQKGANRAENDGKCRHTHHQQQRIAQQLPHTWPPKQLNTAHPTHINRPNHHIEKRQNQRQADQNNQGGQPKWRITVQGVVLFSIGFKLTALAG